MFKIGFGYDAHRLVKDRPLILGSVEIPYEQGLLGHSDADVLIHAVVDAVIGALGMGDIGTHFPDTDPAYKGISSLTLLRQSWAWVEEKGYDLGNLDATIVAEEPKLSPFVPEIRQQIANSIEKSVDHINIKAKTTEGMCFTGRKEGIAAYAVISLIKKDDTIG